MENQEESKITQPQPPFNFQWNQGGPPQILDKNGLLVATLATGNIDGAYSTENILGNVKILLSSELNSEIRV